MEMQDNPKNIGEFYKYSLQELEVKGDDIEWNMIEIQMEKVRFFKFGWGHFNVFYASLIGLTFLFAGGVVVDHFFLTETQVVSKSEVSSSLQEEQHLEAPQEGRSSGEPSEKNNEAEFNALPISSNPNVGTPSKSTTKVVSDGLGKNEKIQVNPASNSSKSIVTAPSTTKAPVLTEAFKKDTLNSKKVIETGSEVEKTNNSITSDNKEVEVTKKPVQVPKKIVYITKQDTLIQVDSVKTKNSRRRK